MVPRDAATSATLQWGDEQKLRQCRLTADRMDECTVLADVSAVEIRDRHKMSLPLFSFAYWPQEPSKDYTCRYQSYAWFLNCKITGAAYIVFREDPALTKEMHFFPLNFLLASSVPT